MSCLVSSIFLVVNTYLRLDHVSSEYFLLTLICLHFVRHDSQTSTVNSRWWHMILKLKVATVFGRNTTSINCLISSNTFLFNCFGRYLWLYRSFVKTPNNQKRLLFFGSRIGFGITYLDDKAKYFRVYWPWDHGL